MLFRAHSKQNLCPTSWHFCDEILISQVTGVSTHHGRPICRVGAWLPGLTKPVRRRVPARPPMGTGRLVSAPCSLKQQCDSGRNLVWRAVAPRLQGGGGCSSRIGSPFHWWTPIRVVFDCCEEFARAESMHDTLIRATLSAGPSSARCSVPLDSGANVPFSVVTLFPLLVPFGNTSSLGPCRVNNRTLKYETHRLPLGAKATSTFGTSGFAEQRA